MKKVMMVVLIVVLLFGVCMAEDYDEYEGCDVYYVVCNPMSCVNLRTKASRGSSVIAWLPFGLEVRVDKETKGFCHLVGLIGEETSGWVSKKFLDIWEPMDDVEGMYRVISDGRLAVRNGINGKVKEWLKPGEEIKVLAMTAKWAIVDDGFVKAEYLEEIE